jgi:hypothetical protein
MIRLPASEISMAQLSVAHTENVLACLEATLVYGRQVENQQQLNDLRGHGFASELACACEFRTVKPGFLERHHILLPNTVSIENKEDILRRLQHMVHSGRNDDIINLILSRTLLPSRIGKKDIFHLAIPGLDVLAQQLADASITDPEFIFDLLHGSLGECAHALRQGSLHMDRGTARALLTKMSTMWVLHDLQIISCRLFQATVFPTGGLLEAEDLRPHTFSGLNKRAAGLSKFFTKLGKLMRCLDPASASQSNGHEITKLRRSLIGFISAKNNPEMYKREARRLGFSETLLSDNDPGISEEQRRYFLQIMDRAEALIEFIESFGQKKFIGRDNIKIKPKSMLHLHSSSIRDRMRPETALAYAVMSSVLTIRDIPSRIDQYLLDFDIHALTSPLLKSTPYKNIEWDIQELLHTYRSVYLWDANFLSKYENSGVDIFATGRAFSPAEIRKHLIRHETAFLQDVGHIHTGEVQRIKTKSDIAKDMIKDAKHAFKQESSVDFSGKSSHFVPTRPDPQLSPALAWRFECRRDHMPVPDLTRPFPRSV